MPLRHGVALGAWSDAMPQRDPVGSYDAVVSPLDRYVAQVLASVEGRRAPGVLAALAEVLAEMVGAPAVRLRDVTGSLVRAEPVHEIVAPPAELRAPWLLGVVHEALITLDDRRRRGAHYTPPGVARDLVGLVLASTNLERTTTWCDPAVGGGAFLVAAADAIVDHEGVPRDAAAARVWGADVDELAVAVARCVLELWAGERVVGIDDRVVVADALGAGVSAADVSAHRLGVWPMVPRRGFDVVVGNPPFLSPLHRRNATQRADGAERVDRRAAAAHAATPYADASARFFALGLRLVAERDGVVGMIQPQSFLSARDSAPVRDEVLRRGGLAALWFARDDVFRAAVRVCAPVVVTGRRPAMVTRRVDVSFDEVAAIAAPFEGSSWSGLILDLLGVPPLPTRCGGTLRDLGATATAGFRDEFYGMAAAARDIAGMGERDVPLEGALRVVTAGSIDVLGHGWGRRAVRLGGRRLVCPVVDPADTAPRVETWLRARRGSKLLVATQTKVLEAVVDIDGDLVGSTPVIEVRVVDALRWHVAAALSSPVATGWALAASAGGARSLTALKLSARQVLDLPLPPLGDAHWDDAAERAEAIALRRGAGAEVAVEVWEAFAEATCRAYRADPRVWVPWWIGRLPALTHRTAPC
jgi:hypothetical protein